MTPMGERVGSAMTKSLSLPKMIVIGFILGFIITISEPDLQVLANQVPSVPNLVLILSVAAGVGAFLVIALLRMLFSMASAAAAGNTVRHCICAGCLCSQRFPCCGV